MSELLKDARQWADKHGPANCWTGTSGTAATIIHQLLEVIEEQKQEIDSLSVRLSGERLESIHIHGHIIEEPHDSSK